MREDIQRALIGMWQAPLEYQAPQWMGAFTQIEILIAVKARTEQGASLFFEVHSEGRLRRVMEESPLVAACTFQRVRVVAAASRKWLIDPDPADLSDDWRLWAYGAQPVARFSGTRGSGCGTTLLHRPTLQTPPSFSTQRGSGGTSWQGGEQPPLQQQSTGDARVLHRVF